MTHVGQKQASYVISGCILLALAAASVSLRFLSAQKRNQSLRPRDLFVSLSLLCMTGFVIAKFIAICQGGLGLHGVDTTHQERTLTMKIFWIGNILSVTSIVAYRLATTLLYMELFRMHRFHGLALITAFFVSLFWIASILLISLICQPLSQIWDGTREGSCGDLRAVQIFNSCLNIFIDIWVVVLPLPVIWTMQITQARKWGITASFAIGISTVGANLGRLIATESCLPTGDFSYCDLNDSILMTAEMCGGILMACVPTLGTLFFSRKLHRGPMPNWDRTGGLATIGSTPIRSKRASLPQFPTLVYSRNDKYEGDRSMIALTDGAAHIEGQSRSSLEDWNTRILMLQ